MKQYNRVCAYIDLDAVEYNIEMMKKNLKEGVRMLAVVKMDGYGHGAVPIAKMLEEKDYIWGYAVATADEALTLCKYGVKKPVLVLGCVFPDQRDALIAQGVRMTVYTKEMAEDLAERAKAIGKDAYIHVKLDTGMSRIGFLPGKESVEEIREIKGLPGLIAEGMYTHFARADETDKTYTQEQIERYLYMKRALEERGASFTYYHCSNSAAIIDIKEANMDLVRAGISTYGLYPSEGGSRDSRQLWGDPYHRQEYEDRDDPGRIWGRVSKKPFQQGICPYPWEEGAHPWQGVHGPAHGGRKRHRRREIRGQSDSYRKRRGRISPGRGVERPV